jgi:serralysin
MRRTFRDAGPAAGPALLDHDGDIVRLAAATTAALENGKPVFTLDQIINQLTRADIAWTGGPGNPTPRAGVGAITYAFFNVASEVYSSERNEFQPLSTAQRDAVRNAFAIWGDFINVTFVEGTVATADINIGNLATDENYFSAYANYPGFSQVAGDMWFSTIATTNQQVGLAEPGFRTIMHEIGHALGMSHPGAYDAEEGVTLTYANNAEYYQDSLQYTIMSYFGSSSTGAVRTSFAATPMAHDIAAIQSLYGANMTVRTGDTHYGFNSNAGKAAFDFSQNTAPVIAIWDAGGVDTLDFSGWSSNSRIDLAPGASSDGGGQTFNVQIAFGTVIENAIAGAGDDRLTGNFTGNVLQGGGGNDIIQGGLGDDRTEGGAGADIFVFGTGDSRDHGLRSDGGKWAPDLIADFVSGTDRIDLSAIDAIAGTPGDDAFAYIGAGAFTGVAGQLRAFTVEGYVQIYGDMNGDALPDLHIVATGTQILAADFIF